MNTQSEVEKREVLALEEQRNLERLKRQLGNVADISLLEKVTAGSKVVSSAEKKPVLDSAVVNLRSVGFDIAPPRTSRKPDLRPSFADVCGDTAFVDELTDSEIATDSELAPEEADELHSKDLFSRVTLSDEAWSINRPVSAIRFHAKHADILLSAHESSTVSTTNRTGVVNVWGLEGGDSRLQRTLLANSSVTALVLPTISSTTVIGATEAGELLGWDLRQKASTPCQRSGASSSDVQFGHARSSVYSLELASAKGELISASSNGTVCIWSVSKFDVPITKFQVRNDISAALRVTALGVPSGSKKLLVKSSQYYFAGGEDGNLYRYEQQGQNWGVARTENAHYAPVTSVSVHPTSRKWALVNDIVLSSSMDWTVKLCNMGTSGKQNAPQLMRNYTVGTPGIIYDVQWSPKHPCVFAVADEAGCISLLDVERSYLSAKVPVCRHTFQQSSAGLGTTPPINRIQWNKDGSMISGGDTAGSVSVWRCSEKLADPSTKEWDRITDFLKRKDDN